MLETMIHDVAGIVHSTFLTGDWVGLLIAFGSVLVASLVMRRGGQIGSMTLLALALFALGGVIRGFFRASDAAAEGYSPVSQLEYSWTRFMDMQAGTLLAYFVAFMALILILFGLRSVLSRG